MSVFLVRNKHTLYKMSSWWPPLLFSGITVKRVTRDLRELDVQMKMHFWNKNLLGSHYGGSIYSMIDPWYCLMLLDNLGKDYIVWDKAAVIRFKSPGMGTITAKCRLTEEVIERVREEADRDGRCQPTFLVEIFDSNGKVVAEIDKMISVRRKDRSKSRTPAVNSEKGRTD